MTNTCVTWCEMFRKIDINLNYIEIIHIRRAYRKNKKNRGYKSDLAIVNSLLFMKSLMVIVT
jgi:hypothetical protein